MGTGAEQEVKGISETVVIMKRFAMENPNWTNIVPIYNLGPIVLHMGATTSTRPTIQLPMQPDLLRHFVYRAVNSKRGR